MTEALLNHQVQSIGGTAVGGDNHGVRGHDIGNSGGAGVEATKGLCWIVLLDDFFLLSFRIVLYCVVLTCVTRSLHL